MSNFVNSLPAEVIKCVEGCSDWQSLKTAFKIKDFN